MAPLGWMRRRKFPKSLTLVIKMMFVNPQDELRAWELVRAQKSRDQDPDEIPALTQALIATAEESPLRPEHVRVRYRRGSLVALVTIEGLRLAYELISEYDDFTNSVELLLRQLESVSEEVLDGQGYGPVVASGKAIDLPQNAGPHRPIVNILMKVLLITQIGLIAVGGLAVSLVDPKAEWVNPTRQAPTILQQVLSFAGFGVLFFPALLTILLAIVESFGGD